MIWIYLITLALALLGGWVLLDRGVVALEVQLRIGPSRPPQPAALGRVPMPEPSLALQRPRPPPREDPRTEVATITPAPARVRAPLGEETLSLLESSLDEVPHGRG